MTQPQPPPPAKASKADLASTTLDSLNKHQLLKKILYGIQIPKTTRATNCTVQLKDVLDARELVDSIIREYQQTLPVTTICTKLDEMSAQIKELQDAVPTLDMTKPTQDACTDAATKPDWVSHLPTRKRTYAAAAAMMTTRRHTQIAPESPRGTTKGGVERSTEGVKLPETEPARERSSRRIIMRFTDSRPAPQERMTPEELRDTVNGALSHAHVQISGAQFTQAGNIALTPQVPHTTEQLLRLSDVFGPHIAHGQPSRGIVFEHDRSWHSVVVSGIQMPEGAGGLGRSIGQIEEMLGEELLDWNLRLGHSLKSVRLLCREDDIWGKERGSLLVSLEDKQEAELAIREGIFMYGEHCRVMPYRPRKKSYSRTDTTEELAKCPGTGPFVTDAACNSPISGLDGQTSEEDERRQCTDVRASIKHTLT